MHVMFRLVGGDASPHPPPKSATGWSHILKKTRYAQWQIRGLILLVFFSDTFLICFKKQT